MKHKVTCAKCGRKLRRNSYCKSCGKDAPRNIELFFFETIHITEDLGIILKIYNPSFRFIKVIYRIFSKLWNLGREEYEEEECHGV